MELLANPSTQLVSASSRSESDAIAGDRIAGDRLAARHFALQHANVAEPPNLELAALDPLLRTLLFTDGTVTRVMEAQTLCNVAVELVEQARTRLPAQAAGHLDVSDGTECLRRRVTMGTDKSIPAVWAESHILPNRLPSGFLGLLESAPNGIGGSIEHARIESRRELLWFRLGKPPHWATAPALASAVVRLYRIVTNGRPALLICEAFAVEWRSGMYRPFGLTGATSDPVDAVALSSSE
jgi:chorismate-pyruvate lyase